MESSALAGLLNAIWSASNLPEGERWRLCNAAVARAQSEPTAKQQQQQSAHVSAVEEVLANIKKHVGIEGILKVEDGKKWLRSHGERGTRAASVLGRLSKGRNLEAHPLVQQLVVEIDMLAEEAKNTTAVARNSTGKDTTNSNGEDDKLLPEVAPFPAVPRLTSLAHEPAQHGAIMEEKASNAGTEVPCSLANTEDAKPVGVSEGSDHDKLRELPVPAIAEPKCETVTLREPNNLDAIDVPTWVVGEATFARMPKGAKDCIRLLHQDGCDWESIKRAIAVAIKGRRWKGGGRQHASGLSALVELLS